MNKFTSLFHPRDKPQNSLNGSRYSFFFGGTTSGKPVNENTAMQMTAVYSCVRILSEAIAGLPLYVYKYNDGGSKEKDLQHPLYRLLHDEPNPEMTSFVFRETLMGHLLLWGNAYAQVIRNARGEVIGLYPLMPNKMTVDRDENGHLWYVSDGTSVRVPMKTEQSFSISYNWSEMPSALDEKMADTLMSTIFLLFCFLLDHF
jgi:phage portal protein BeeE